MPAADTETWVAELRRIAPGEAAVLVEAGYATLVEVRRPGRRPRWHVEGALSLLVDGTDTSPGALPRGEVPAEHLLILYCADPDACVVTAVARSMIVQGWDPRRLAILVGGAEAWLQVGLPVVAPEATDQKECGHGNPNAV